MKTFNNSARFKEAERKMANILRQSPIIPLIGIDKTGQFEHLIIAAIQASQHGSIPAIEVLLRDENALDAGLGKLAELKKQYGNRIHVLVGSVIKPDDVDKAARAKIDGLVSGGYSAEIAQAASQKGLPYLPGCMTLDEVKAANEEHGLKLIKLFPARSPSAKVIMASLSRTGVKPYAPNDGEKPKGLTVCRTATEVLTAWSNSEKEVILDPANSDTQWHAIMDYMSKNGMVACSTGGARSDNLHEFAQEPQVIGVGASFIVDDAEKSDQNFVDALTQIQSTAVTNWSAAKAQVPDQNLEL